MKQHSKIKKIASSVYAKTLTFLRQQKWTGYLRNRTCEIDSLSCSNVQLALSGLSKTKDRRQSLVVTLNVEEWHLTARALKAYAHTTQNVITSVK